MSTMARMMEVGPTDGWKLRQQRINVVHELAIEARVESLYVKWQQLQKASEGEGTAVCLDPDVVKAGEGLFWHESLKEEGRLFLFSPQRAAAVLQHRLRGGTNGNNL